MRNMKLERWRGRKEGTNKQWQEGKASKGRNKTRKSERQRDKKYNHKTIMYIILIS